MSVTHTTTFLTHFILCNTCGTNSHLPSNTSCSRQTPHTSDDDERRWLISASFAINLTNEMKIPIFTLEKQMGDGETINQSLNKLLKCTLIPFTKSLL